MAYNFSASTIPNCVLWLEGSTGLFTDTGKATPVTVNGSAVGCWADQSGNGNDFSQATGANQPLLETASTCGSQAGLRFDGSTKNFTGGKPALLENLQYSGWTVSFVVNAAVIPVVGTIFSKSSGSGSATETLSYAVDAASTANNNLNCFTRYQEAISVSGGNSKQGVIATSTTYVLTARTVILQNESVSGTAATLAEETLFINGRKVATYIHTLNGWNGTANWRIGCDDAAAHLFNGDMALVTMWNRPLSDGELEELHSYASYKYGCKAERNLFPRKTDDTTQRQRIIVCGNSIPHGANGSGFDAFTQAAPSIRYPVQIINCAISGMTSTLLRTTVPYKDATFLEPGQRNIIFVWEITNELAANVAAATAYGNFVNLCNDWRALTSDVIVVLSCLNRTTGFSGGQTSGGFATSQATVNGNLRSDFNVPTSDSLIYKAAGSTAYADYFIDVQSDATLATLLFDPHPGIAQYTTIGSYIAKCVNQIVAADPLTAAKPSVTLGSGRFKI